MKGRSILVQEGTLGALVEQEFQVRGAKPSSRYYLIVCKTRFQSDLWDCEIVKFTFGLNYWYKMC